MEIVPDRTADDGNHHSRDPQTDCDRRTDTLARGLADAKIQVNGGSARVRACRDAG